MKVQLGTIEVDEIFRRALRIYYGKPGLATRIEVRAWAHSFINRGVLEIVDDLVEAEHRFAYDRIDGGDDA